MNVLFATLGCPKNEVDTAGMATLLQRAGYTPVADPRRADVMIVNTCAFIASAREESLAVLQELAEEKRHDQVLIAAGCMGGRYAEQLRQIEGVDACLDTNDWQEIALLTAQLTGGEFAPARDIPPFPDIGLSSRLGDTAYLKIAEGCDAHCTFCTLPQIKGPYRSVSRKLILNEARSLVAQGVQEIILIAQDTTAYGSDQGQEDGLPGLLEALLEAVPRLPWLRIMYAYPGHISERLIEVMAANPQICPYLDLPLQHAHPDTLRRMGRPADVEALRDLLNRLRQRIPDLVLRSTFIVGFPGETEEEFATLRRFLEQEAFERVGVFVYSAEELTPACRLPNPVPQEVAERRRDELMVLQQEIAHQWGKQQVGRTIEVLVEGIAEEGLIVGRSQWDAPEVDGLVLATPPEGEAPTVTSGSIIPVRITAASAYDLWGEAIVDD